VVKDNQTVVIGGLMQEQDEDQTTKMPFLGDIPLLGWLFKTKSVTKNKTNLIVFLNPHIIKEADRLAELSRVKDREFAVASRRYVSGELMVKFKEGVPDEKVRSTISEKGATVIKFMDKLRVYQLRLKAKQSVEDAVDEFSKIPEVEYAEPNYVITIN
jgi:general secretion pathway protein D